ncbi:hypothetical protein [Aeromonas veronii]|uniref:hypothetical protein n=1 Tax=Aeromonas veronii TaxID=654 RepID=UPI003B9F7729
MYSKIENDIFQIDIEFGNENTYFSGKRNIIPYQTPYDIDTEFSISFEAEIEGAKGKVSDKIEKVANNVWHRNVSFYTYSDSHLFDFVSRYVVKTKSPIAYINNKVVKHQCSNIYYQCLSSNLTVEVPIDDNFNLIFRELCSSQEDSFDNVFYLRDESIDNGTYKWIVHHRKIVKIEQAKLILRGCNPRFEGVLPFQHLVPQILKKPFFRIRESRYPRCPIMAVGVVDVSNVDFNLMTEIRLVNV